MKKLRKLFSSNKGNATYYVMVVIMVITIMVSGLLAVSLRSSVVSTNYTTDIESYNKCDSVLQKIKGELRVALVEKTVVGSDSLVDTGSASTIIFAAGGKNEVVAGVTIKNYYPIDYDANEKYKLCIYDIVGNLEEAESQVVIKGEVISNDESNKGFWVEEYHDRNDIVIKSVHVECGNVGIIADIKIAIDSDNKVTDVVFENYKIISVTAEGGDQQ